MTTAETISYNVMLFPRFIWSWVYFNLGFQTLGNHPVSLPQIPIQPLWHPDRPPIHDQCCHCSAAAATVHRHGRTTERRRLLGEDRHSSLYACTNFQQHRSLCTKCMDWCLGSEHVGHRETLFSHKHIHVTVTFRLCYPPVLQINLGLLIFSLAGFLLPGYLFYHRRHLVREKEARDKRAASQEMQALNHTEANGHKPHSNGTSAVEA